MDCIVSPQNLCIETLASNVTVFGGGAFGRQLVIRVEPLLEKTCKDTARR